MERSTIIKALECCANYKDWDSCKKCPLHNNGCEQNVLEGLALALIKQQEEQIFQLENRLKECENGYAGTLHLESCKLHDAEERVKELTEECENYKKVAEYQQNCNMDRGFKIKRLTEENERLKEKADRHLDNLKAVLEERSENTIVADTVREFAERLKKECLVDSGYEVLQIGTIDRIAEEMLGKECTDCKHFAGCECFDGKVCDLYEKK